MTAAVSVKQTWDLSWFSLSSSCSTVVWRAFISALCCWRMASLSWRALSKLALRRFSRFVSSMIWSLSRSIVAWEARSWAADLLSASASLSFHLLSRASRPSICLAHLSKRARTLPSLAFAVSSSPLGTKSGLSASLLLASAGDSEEVTSAFFSARADFSSGFFDSMDFSFSVDESTAETSSPDRMVHTSFMRLASIGPGFMRSVSSPWTTFICSSYLSRTLANLGSKGNVKQNNFFHLLLHPKWCHHYLLLGFLINF